MKIEFSAQLKPTLDSLKDKAQPHKHNYEGFVTGSQIMLRARLMCRPEEAPLINPLLEDKDLDIRFEPRDGVQANLGDLRKITEEFNENLSKKQKYKLDEAWTSYYTLPSSEVKCGKKNKIDTSIQGMQIKPCMNTDVKSTFSGELVYATERHKQDFEETYLKHNMIMFYDIDKFKSDNFQDLNTMAFRLTKCMKPEITRFNCLLSIETSVFVKSLLEDAQHDNAKSAIFSLIEKHYEIPLNVSLLAITSLCERSISFHKAKLSEELNKEASVVRSMIEFISIKQSVHSINAELSSILSSPSSPTVKYLSTQLKNLSIFKVKLSQLYEECDQLNQQEAKKILDAQKPTPAPILTEEVKKPNDIQIKKRKPKPIARFAPVVEDIDAALRDAKKHYPKPSGLSEEFVQLVNSDRDRLTKINLPLVIPKQANKNSRNSIIAYTVVLDFINKSISDKSLEAFFFKINDFYKAKVQELIQRLYKVDQISLVPEESYEELFVTLDKIKETLTPKEMVLRCIHFVLTSIYLHPGFTFDPQLMKKGVNQLKNYRESKTRDLEALLKCFLEYAMKEYENPAETAIKILSTCVSVDLLHILKGKRTTRTLVDLQILFELSTKITMFLHYNDPINVLEYTFFSTVLKVHIEQTSDRPLVLRMFYDNFIRQTLLNLFLRTKAYDFKDFYRTLLWSTTVVLLQSLYPDSAFPRTDVLVGHVLNLIESSVKDTIFAYHALSLVAPRLTNDLSKPLVFDLMVHVSDIPCADGSSDVFNIRNIEKLQEILLKLIEDICRLMQRCKHEMPEGEKHCFDIVIKAVEILSGNTSLVFESDFLPKFTALVNSNDMVKKSLMLIYQHKLPVQATILNQYKSNESVQNNTRITQTQVSTKVCNSF